jgi:hypothetical protein
MRPFQLRRVVRLDEHGPVTVIIDLLMPREAEFQRNKPPLLANFAVQKADGAGVAMRWFVQHTLDGTMPDGRRNTVELKGVRQFEGGPDALADACRPLLEDPVALKGFKCIASKFTDGTAYGPVTVRRFLDDSAALGDMTADQVQRDAFLQVKAWLDRLGL